MGAIVAHLLADGSAETGKLRRMLALTPYRGRVHEFLVHGSCALGVSYDTDWPTASLATDGRLAAAIYGSIDNLDELSRTLLGLPAAQVASGPAAIVIAAFQMFGDATPGHLRGVFGVVLTDGRTLRCFRDHIGYAPLFYRCDERSILVASEAKQIVLGSGIRAEPDLDVFEATYYSIDVPDETRCPIRGVNRVPQRKLLVANPPNVRTAAYWDPESVLESARFSPAELKERFEQLMTQAVARMMTPDTLISLSGGIDSPAIAAFAAPEFLKATGRPLPALSVVYPKYPTVDERRWVELVASRFGMPLHIYEPQARPLDGLEEWVRLCDSPVMAESLAQSTEFFAEARKLGARTILSGDVAEFVFDLGQRHLLPHLLFRGRVAAIRRYLAGQRARGVSRTALARQLLKAVAPDFIVDGRERARYRPFFPDWLDTARLERVAAPLPPRWRRWRYWQVGVLSYPNLAAESEAISQALYGVQVRRPWADVDLWEFFLSLRAETKFPDVEPRKLLVRRLVRGRVPEEILTRVKQYYDEAAIASVDYPLLRRLLVAGDFRMPGVNYDRLAMRLRSEDLRLPELPYAYALAAMHSFTFQLASAPSIDRGAQRISVTEPTPVGPGPTM